MEDRYVKERERSKIPEKYKWDLGDILPDDTAWQEAKKKLPEQLQSLVEVKE